ncbi:hypothetical protein BCV72DRAFT_332476 [Rhizopus microsporus var. microsporus]|uniref:C2H2-type domain-containing protein n=1 Tax=Rhizopus microsporus var. microsporus TaxID=86635 RepID=A0A1X0RGP1_RHIZD|nr:hypothetical protein BCV72DRAFT_332476 [Rhizopus microsporus var. microsporus]
MSLSRGRPLFQLAADQFHTTNKENAIIVKYTCSCCNHYFDELANLGAHLDTHLGQHGASVDSADDLLKVDDDNGLEPEDQPTIQEPLPTISPSLHPGKIAINPISVNPPRKNFDEAAINACQQLDSKHVERQKALYIVDALDLKLFTIFDKNGIEQNALAHERVISSITTDNDSILPILPLKHLYDEESAPCMKCRYITTPGFDRVLASLPYNKLTRRRQYVELSSAMCKLLNQDWEFHPQMRYFTAKVFFGAIMHNTGNGRRQTFTVVTPRIYSSRTLI